MIWHLVILDDSKFTRNLLKLPLERAGFTVAEAGTPEEALAAIADRPTQLVLSDLRMPNLEDGLQFLKDLAKRNRTMPVLIYSSETQSEDVVRAIGLKNIDFLSKPAAPDRLQEKIVSLIRNKKE